MKVLVTGADGFVGRYLLKELKALGHGTAALIFVEPKPALEYADEVHWAEITDTAAVDKAVISIKPDACVHLAAVSSVVEGKLDPVSMFRVNVTGTVSLIESFRKNCPKARFLFVSSAQVYGNKARPNLIKESDGFDPVNGYGASKAAADLMVLAYAREHAMDTVVVRPHNHIGPGQSSRFVVPSFAKQAKDIAAGKASSVVEVGNLSSQRDFCDVRDVVRAYALLLEKGRAGEAYNLAANRPVQIRDILMQLCEIAGIKPEIRVRQDLFRSAEECPTLDLSKIQRDADWKPQISLKTTLHDIYASA